MLGSKSILQVWTREVGGEKLKMQKKDKSIENKEGMGNLFFPAILKLSTPSFMYCITRYPLQQWFLTSCIRTHL